MDARTVFPSKFLKAADLGDAAPIVTISHVDMETMPGDAKERRLVAFFEGKSKGVVLNLTNTNAIAAITGTHETDEWPGTQVQLYVAIVSFKGEEVEAIRIRAPKKIAPARPKPAPVADDNLEDAPF